MVQFTVIIFFKKTKLLQTETSWQTVRYATANSTLHPATAIAGYAVLFVLRLYRVYTKRYRSCFYRQRGERQHQTTQPIHPNRPKPEWVKAKIIHTKAIMGDNVGCRKIAECFNRGNHKGETVGKTYVANIIAKHQYEIHIERRKIKNKTELQHWLSHFRTWYNQQRPHQHLGGKTPEDVWRWRR